LLLSAETGVVENIGCRLPQSLQDFIRAHIPELCESIFIGLRELVFHHGQVNHSKS
jgi:hypothetical protein